MGVHTDEAISLIHNRPGFAREVARQVGYTHIYTVYKKPVLGGFGLTSKQAQLLDFIRDYRSENGFTPSYDEMREEMGLASKSGIHRLVTALEERGHVFRVPNLARCIVLAGSLNTQNNEVETA